MFERIRYPDGQISAKLVSPIKDGVIRERINSYEDLFYVRAIADVLHSEGSIFRLFIPCMFGQRSDRRFDRFQSFDLKLITDTINECKFDTVEIFDPHSDVCMALINNSEKVSSFKYVQKAVADLYRPETGINTCNFTLVSPDAGAYKKVFEYGEKMNLPVVGAMKYRGEDGSISMSFMGDVKDKHCLIVDDLCDGGATFLYLATMLKDQGAQKVYLYVSHGLFSKGFDALRNVIDHIYCTNSVKDINFAPAQLKDPFLTQYKVI